MDITVKKSKIDEKGVFANRSFKKGEVVLKWNPKVLNKLEAERLSAEKKHYLYQDENNNCFLMQAPEKYINHSCNPNIVARDKCDVAIRDIKKGEELTSDYSKSGAFISFQCRCANKNCRGLIKP